MTDRECYDIVLRIMRAAGIEGIDTQRIIGIVRALDKGCWNPLNSNPMTFIYTNHRGETALRKVAPIRIYHGSTEFHQEPQWLLEAIDLDKDALRTFAMRDMKEIK